MEGDADGIGCNYEKLVEHTRIGKPIYIHDGAVTGTIVAVGDVSSMTSKTLGSCQD